MSELGSVVWKKHSAKRAVSAYQPVSQLPGTRHSRQNSSHAGELPTCLGSSRRTMPAHLCGCLAWGIGRPMERQLCFPPKHHSTHGPLGI